MVERVDNFKGCSIQSDEQVDARNWLRNDSFEEVDAVNDSDFFFVDGSEVEEMKRYINNIICHTPFHSPGTKSVQKKDASWSLER